MIKSFTVKAFKSIPDLTIELGQINVFIGANGSGKSNILEAMGVLSAAASGIVDDESLMRRGVRPGVPDLYKTSFKNLNPSDCIFMEAQNEGAGYSVSLNYIEEKSQFSKPYKWIYKTEHFADSGKTIMNRKAETRWGERGLA
ncbi:MAG: AAA family ATPase, partial [Candidatus Sabulitectum sp.]|nr:AAA family ATPase [Candidatus Sabulitectum sp.]